MASNDTEVAALFNGMKFWLSHTVPQRARFIAEITNNGGNVVTLENDADVKLVDHTRKSLPPNTYSYQYVEQSLRKKRLERLDEHIAGPPPGQARAVGDTTVTTKGGRTPFTSADDQYLWDWVKPLEEAGQSVKGNEIYKQLEAQNPRHTYQSWRDRWIKHVSMRNMQYSRSRELHSSEHPHPPRSVTSKAVNRFASFTPDEYDMLLTVGEHIMNMDSRMVHEAWTNLAKEVIPLHREQILFKANSDIVPTAFWVEWQAYWEEVVRPVYKKQSERLTVQGKDGMTDKPVQDTTTQTAQPPDLSGSKSPTFQPESPSFQSSNKSSQSQRPNSNEARKRSPVRQLSNLDGSSISPRAKRKRNDLEDNHTRTTSNRRSGNESAVLRSTAKIPSSPPSGLQEHRDQLQHTSHSEEAFVGSRQSTLDQPYSPLFVPEDSDIETPQPKHARSQRNSPQTSPMNIRLSLDGSQGSTFENGVLGPSAQVPRLASEELGDHDGDIESVTSEDNFETAQTGNVNDSERFETAPQGRLETQAILEQSQPGLDFGLAEPEGGWSAYEEQPADEDSNEIETANEKTPKPPQIITRSYEIPSSDPGDFPSSGPRLTESQQLQHSPHVARVIEKQGPSATLSSPSRGTPKTARLSRGTSAPNPALPPCNDLDTYLTTRLAYFSSNSSGPGDSDIRSLLLRAVRRTLTSVTAAAPASFFLADKVFDCFSHGLPVPRDVRGIWTESDDKDLMGGDARKVDRVSRKHGDEGVEGRWEVLTVIGVRSAS